MSIVLITGARGFTAQYLAKKLTSIGCSVYATSLCLNEATNISCYKGVLECDVRNKDSILTVLNTVKPNYVVHLSALSFVGHSNPAEFYSVNTIGTENVLQSIKKSDAPIKSILLASSANIYGSPDQAVLDENTVPNPVNHYAISKLSMEHIARTYLPDLPIIISRPFNYIGFGQNENFVIPKIVKAFANKDNEIHLGNINVSRDFSAVYDLVDAYCELLFSKEVFGETFNICSGAATSLSSIIATLANISNHEIEIKINPAFVRENEIKSLQGSNEKLKKYTNWHAKVSLEEILHEMYIKYKAIQ